MQKKVEERGWRRGGRSGDGKGKRGAGCEIEGKERG